MHLLLLGATGLVGRHVLSQALATSRVTSVTAPVRRALQVAHATLHAPVVDFDALPADAAWWHADAVICALGTTMRVAGSEDAFRRVDHDYPLAAARLAHRHGTSTFVLNSAMGADRGSRFFYNRVKGEVEHDLADVGFASLRARGDARRAGGGVASVDVARMSARAPRGHTCCLHATNQPGARTP